MLWKEGNVQCLIQWWVDDKKEARQIGLNHAQQQGLGSSGLYVCHVHSMGQNLVHVHMHNFSDICNYLAHNFHSKLSSRGLFKMFIPLQTNVLHKCQGFPVLASKNGACSKKCTITLPRQSHLIMRDITFTTPDVLHLPPLTYPCTWDWMVVCRYCWIDRFYINM